MASDKINWNIGIFLSLFTPTLVFVAVYWLETKNIPTTKNEHRIYLKEEPENGTIVVNVSDEEFKKLKLLMKLHERLKEMNDND